MIMDATGPTNFRKDYRLLRQGGRLIMYGLSEAHHRQGRNIPGAGPRASPRMPLATMPWWKSLSVMNENKGVFGLNMLSWQDTEGLDRVLEPLSAELESGDFIDPVVAEAFPFDRAGDAHMFIAERRNIGKVVLVPRALADRPGAGLRSMKMRLRERQSSGGPVRAGGCDRPLGRRLPLHIRA